MPSFESMQNKKDLNIISYEIRRQSDFVMNATFTSDPAYKRVKILTPNGWEMQDAKYQKHTTPSILKDEVDYYLQFRPGVHYPLGTYVIIPDDTSPEINTPENPFDQPVAERTRWWLIVGRTDANQFVRYSAIKCNWLFQWIYNGKIQSCYGCVRDSSSYTSGEWSGDKTTVLDNIASAWLPDIKYTYGANFKALGLDDIQSINHKTRFMISDNIINPNTYKVSKIIELLPAGIVKLTMRQDEDRSSRDNIPLRICDYYDEGGEPLVNPPAPDPSVGSSEIKLMAKDEFGELDFVENQPSTIQLHLKETAYFFAEFSDDYTGQYVWTLDIVDDYEDADGEYVDKYSEEYENTLVNYMKITDFHDGSISIKPQRVKDLIGNKFILSVSDEGGGHSSQVELEVIGND